MYDEVCVLKSNTICTKNKEIYSSICKCKIYLFVLVLFPVTRIIVNDNITKKVLAF